MIKLKLNVQNVKHQLLKIYLILINLWYQKKIKIYSSWKIVILMKNINVMQLNIVLIVQNFYVMNV